VSTAWEPSKPEKIFSCPLLPEFSVSHCLPHILFSLQRVKQGIVALHICLKAEAIIERI
jgi:hypothetical protein